MTSLSVDKVMLRAKTHARRGEVGEALKLYQVILEKFPNNKRAQKGFAALDKARFSIVNRNPSKQALQELVHLYNTGKLEAAVEMADTLAKTYPKTLLIWNIFGAAKKGLGCVDEAVTAFRKVTELNPSYAEGFNNWGVALKDQGKFDQAIQAYKKALSIKADYADAYYNLGITHKELTNLDEAIEAYKMAISLKSDYSEAYTNMGNALKEKGKMDEAMNAYKNALSLRPDCAEAFFNLGVVLQEKNELIDAIKAYHSALSIKPLYAEVYYNLGKVFQEQGNLDQSVEAYSKATTINPRYADAFNNMGDALKEKGKLEKAVAAYKNALALKSDYPEGYFNLGNVLKDQGKLEAAITAYKKAISIKNNFAEAYNNMGNVLAQQGELDDAISAYQYALTYKPDHVEAFNNLQAFEVQFPEPKRNFPNSVKGQNNQLEIKLAGSAKHQIHRAILYYLLGDIGSCSYKLKQYGELVSDGALDTLNLKDQVFCNGYFNFLINLIKKCPPLEERVGSRVYHLGESHCLSFAYSQVLISQELHTIIPRIIFGGKAFHFSSGLENKYKKLTKNHLHSIPRNSKVFVSFGEIDCRASEGLIPASLKSGKPIRELIRKTIDGYIDWFMSQNVEKKHNYFFFNVPAPTRNRNITEELNIEVSKTISIFNVDLKEKILNSGAKIVDVYKQTADNDGFSNSIFHCDDVHLDSRILPFIDEQLTMKKRS